MIMKNLTDEKFNEEWAIYWKNMEEVGLASIYKEEGTKKLMRTAAAALSEDTGLAYPAALLVHINRMTSIAMRIADMLNGAIEVDKKSLLKVCLLHQFSKIFMYIPNDNEWEVEKRGMNYKFRELNGKLKFGERSIFYAVKKGVTLNEFEWEAMECLDKDGEAKTGKSFENILTTIVRQANELAYAIARNEQ